MEKVISNPPIVLTKHIKVCSDCPLFVPEERTPGGMPLCMHSDGPVFPYSHCIEHKEVHPECPVDFIEYVICKKRE